MVLFDKAKQKTFWKINTVYQQDTANFVCFITWKLVDIRSFYILAAAYLVRFKIFLEFFQKPMQVAGGHAYVSFLISFSNNLPTFITRVFLFNFLKSGLNYEIQRELCLNRIIWLETTRQYPYLSKKNNIIMISIDWIE